MMKVLKHIFKTKQSGFSLVEIITAVGVLGLGALMTMKASEMVNKQSQDVETSVSIDNFVFGLESFLAKREVCRINFQGVVANNALKVHTVNGSAVQGALVDASGNIVYRVDTPYENGAFRITSMMTSRPEADQNAYLKLTIVKKVNNREVSVNREVPILVDIAGTNPGTISDCYGFEDQVIEDIHNELAKKLCNHPGGPLNGVYNEAAKTCTVKGFNGITTPCPVGQAVVAINLVGDQFVPQCGHPVAFSDCPNGWTRSITPNADGIGVSTSCLPGIGSLYDDVNRTTFNTTNQNCGLKVNAAGNKIFMNCGPGRIRFNPILQNPTLPTITPPTPTPSCTPACNITSDQVCTGVRFNCQSNGCGGLCPSFFGTKVCTSPSQGLSCVIHIDQVNP